jgi:hypothetical protein
VDWRLANAVWKSFDCTVAEPLNGARDDTVVLDTREVVDVDATDILLGRMDGA